MRARWSTWSTRATSVIAPWLWLFECHATLRRKVHRRELTDAEGAEAWRHLLGQPIESAHSSQIFDRAWSIARALKLSTTYDAVYLALAELRDCDLWTADRRFAAAAGRKYPRIRSV